MKNKDKIILIICFLVIGISIGGYLSVQVFLNRDLEKEKESLKETINQYGFVEQETVATLIAKFNTEILDGGIKFPASDDSLNFSTTEYWYQMSGGIYCYVVPVEFTGNKNQDIAEMMAIGYPKGSGDELALEYVKKLLKANQDHFTNKEIADLIDKAMRPSNGENIQSGKGIAVAVKETEDNYEFQVIRIYQ